MKSEKPKVYPMTPEEYGWVRHIVTRICGGVGRLDLVQDLTQVTAMTLAKKADLNPKLLGKKARWVAYDKLRVMSGARHRNRPPIVPISDFREEGRMKESLAVRRFGVMEDEMPDSLVTNRDDDEMIDLRREILRLMDSLNPQERALMKHMENGLVLREASVKMGVSEAWCCCVRKTIRERFHAAREV